jgi:hypothetical protein
LQVMEELNSSTLYRIYPFRQMRRGKYGAKMLSRTVTQLGMGWFTK